MYLKLFALFLYIDSTITVQTRPCNISETVKISKGTHLPNGVIYFDGIKYGRNEYFLDEDGVQRGCICLKKKCINKCCPFGLGYDSFHKACVNTSAVFDPPVWGRFRRLEGVKAVERFHFLIGKKNCTHPEIRIAVGQATNVYHIKTDGQLYLEVPQSIPPWILRGPDKYCIDTFVSEDANGKKTSRLDALICFAEKQDQHSTYILSSTCMLISCVFILATLAVYAWLPELRNLHGMVLMVYLLNFFVGFLLLATMQIMIIRDQITQSACVSMSIVIYFALLSAFFWLNVMSFDIWWTFSGKRGHSARLKSTKARFCAYAVYAFGIPTALTILLVSLEFSGLPPQVWMPLLRHQGCFIYGTSKLIYLYGPIMILCVANLGFFILTAMKIAQIKKQTSVLKSKENSTHDQHRGDKQRLVLYLKLFMVMGISWVLEVISSIYPEFALWKLTDAYNVLIGVIIFIIFVCKRKIFRLIKKRYKQLRGDPMSRNQTTISSRTTSIRTDDVQLNSVKNGSTVK